MAKIDCERIPEAEQRVAAAEQELEAARARHEGNPRWPEVERKIQEKLLKARARLEALKALCESGEGEE